MRTEKSQIISMKANRMTNPLGFNLGQPSLSWVTEAPGATVQTAAQVLVARDEKFADIIFDSGKCVDLDSLGYQPKVKLEPRTRYYWNVRVWTDDGQIVESPAAWFETAKMDEAWSGEWITPDWSDKDIHPLFRKSFPVDQAVSSARAYVSGLGLYHLEINGKKVGDEQLTPFCNAYDKWIQYQTFDVTDLLQTGDNAMGAMLGAGWYKGRFGFSNLGENIYGDTYALLCELVITYEDGSTEVIATDHSWKAVPGPVQMSNIYDGEWYNANKEVAGWSERSCNEENWSGVKGVDIGFERLEARRSIPVRIMEELKPVKVINTPKQEIVLDMGQNMVGWVRFQVDAPAGTEVFLQYGEEMQDGCFYRENLRTAKAEYHYISDGKPALVQPHFTFYGFRYVKIEGWPGSVRAEDFTGCVVYSAMDATGHIETSNPLVNKLFENALWGQKGNFLDVPTDCPQRDERMGWTGDAQVFSGTACFNMDADAFFHKYLYDLALEQKEAGTVPHVVPTFTMGKGQSNGFLAGGSTAWGEAATVIPWNLYLHFADKRILQQQFESMKGWVDYIQAQESGDRLWNTGFHFGDWLALDGPDPFSPMGGTPNDLIATALYAYSAEIVSKAAAVLGKDDLAHEYATLSSEIKASIQNEFFSANGRLAVDTQTAYVLALFLDLMPQHFRGRVADTLKKKLEANLVHLQTGFVGTPYICRVLSENGYNDIAYRLLLNDDFPSWLYAVKMGATTIWERWNSLLPDGKFGELGMNSLNHYAYGSIVEWMYRNMCGLNPREDAPGFKKINLRPQPFGLLQSAAASLKSAAGHYESSWKISEDGTLNFFFAIPFNASADLLLPDCKLSDVWVNGKAIADAELSASEANGSVTAVLTTGEYEINYLPTRDYIIRFSSYSNLSDLLANEKTKAILFEQMPGSEQMLQRGGGMMRRMMAQPLREIANNPMVPISADALDKLDQALADVSVWD